MAYVPAWRRIGLQLKGESQQHQQGTKTSEEGRNLEEKSLKKRLLANEEDSKPKRQKREAAADIPERKPIGLFPRQANGDVGGKSEVVKQANEGDHQNPKKPSKPQKKKKSKKSKLDSSKQVQQPTNPEIALSQASTCIEYITRFQNDRKEWKFNKSIQNHLLRYAFDVKRIPPNHNEALVLYFSGLQGEGPRRLLTEQSQDILAKPFNPNHPQDSKTKGPIQKVKTAEGNQETPDSDTMDRPEIRQKAKKDALKAHIDIHKKVVKESLKRKDEREYERGFTKKLETRRRAEKILAALRQFDKMNGLESLRKIDATNEDAAKSGAQKGAPEEKTVSERPKRTARGRKRRTVAFQTGIPDDDESSNSSSSSSSSSSSEDSDDNGGGAITNQNEESESSDTDSDSSESTQSTQSSKD